MSASAPFCAPDDTPRVLAAILERSDDAIVRADLDGVISGWSPGASRLFGYSREDAIGSSVAMLIPDEKWDEFARILDRIRDGAAINQCETVRRAKDGRLLDVLLSALPITNDANRTIGVLSISRDLTALRKTEMAHRASEARWRAIIDSAVDAIIVIDSRGRIEAFNAAAEQLFGYDARDVIGQSVNLLMPPPYRDEHDGYLANYLAGAPAKIIGLGREVTARRRSGEDFPARLAVGEASVDGETRFTGIVHDLTGRVQMEHQLREQTALAKLGEMAAIVAHEVRNALAAVRGTVQVIGTRFEPETRERTALDEVVTRIDALTKIVNDMLLYANLPKPLLAPVDVRDVVALAWASANVDQHFQEAGIDVTGTAGPLLADAELLRIVFTNLLTNSAQATQGTGTIRVEITETTTACEIAVIDHGQGMPAEARERLFVPFFTTKARGSGLGLATVKRIVESHGGTVRVLSSPAGGTSVIVELPIRPIKREQTESSSTP